MDDNPDIEIHGTRTDLDLMFNLWPDNFASMFDMGLRTFERLFNHRPQLKQHFNLPIEDESWRRDDRIKKIVLALEQTLARAVATFADPQPDAGNTPVEFAQHLREIGGLHRAIVPTICPDNYELLFKLLPEVIVDVTSSRRKKGPLSADERQQLFLVWNQVGGLMSRQFMLGWVRRVVPQTPKLHRVYRSEQSEEDEYYGSTRTSCSSGAGLPTTPSIRRGAAAGAISSRHRAHRSRTQDEVMPWTLERGHSAPLALHDLHVELQRKSPQH